MNLHVSPALSEAQRDLEILLPRSQMRWRIFFFFFFSYTTDGIRPTLSSPWKNTSRFARRVKATVFFSPQKIWGYKHQIGRRKDERLFQKHCYKHGAGLEVQIAKGRDAFCSGGL
jgi:hypothetical protein